MRKKKKQTEGWDPDLQLREEAEGKLAGFPDVPDGIQEKNFEEVIHELQVHQIELEMQNEELRKTQVALEEARERYADLYHFAPVGYFTFTPEALIKEVNLTGSALVGVARQKLINTRFRRIVTDKDQDLWDQHFLSVLLEGEKRTCDLILKRPEGSTFYAGLESIRREVGPGVFQVHTTVTDITERKSLEKVIRQSEERYRTAVIEEIGEGYYEADLAGNFTFVNDSMTRQLQYSREELIGMNYRTYAPPEETEEVYKTFNRVYRTGEIIKDYPMRSIRKDGTLTFLEDSISCLRDREGRVIGFRGISRDVSKRKRAEQILKESEIRFRTIFESSKDGIIFFEGKNGKIILANKAMAEMLGCLQDDLTGRMIPFLTPREDRVWIEKEYQKHLSGEISVSKEIPVLRDDGSVFFADISTSPIALEGRTFFSAFFHDITERKQAEEALRQSEGKYRLIAENMADIIVVLDMNLQFTYISPSIIHIRGFTVEEAMGQTPDQVLTPESLKIALAVLEEEMKLETSGTADPGRIRTLEVEEYRKDGSTIWAEVSSSFLRDENQKAVGILSVSRDISERKQAEEANKISLTKYQTLFESLPLGVTVSDMAGNILESNKEADKLLGLPRGEQTRRAIDGLEWRIIRPDGSPMPAEEFASVRALKVNGLIENVEMGMVKGEGQVTWINVTAAPIPLPDYGVVIVYSDITENNRVEKALQESEDQYRDLVESSRDLMCIHDLTGKILWVNQEPIRILGYDKDFILGRNIRDFLDSDRKDEFDEYLATIRSQGVASGLLKTYTAKGEKRIWEYHNTLRTEGIAEPIIRGMAHDITERKRAEGEAVQHAKNMEFLSETAMGFVDLPAGNDIYRFIGEKLKQLVGEAVFVLVNSIDQTTRKTQLRALQAEEQSMRAVLKTLGEDPTGMSLALSEEAWNDFITGEIRQVLGGIITLSFGEIPEAVCDTLEKVAGIGEIFAIGFAKKEELYGSAIIVMRKGSELSNRDVIETFVHQAGVALQRKRVEEALWQSEANLKEAQHVAHIGHWELDNVKGTPKWSEEIFHIFGLDPSQNEPSFKDHQKIVHPDDWDILDKAVTKAIIEGVPFNIEFRFLRPDSSIRWMNSKGNITRDDEGHVVRIFGIAQDVTERKKAEEGLKKAEEKYRNIFENAIEGIFQTTPDGRCLAANAALAHMLGYHAPEELIRSITDIENQVYADPDRLGELRRLLESRDKVEGFETPLYRKDGQIIWTSINIRAVRNEKGEDLFYEGTCIDITEKKSLQTEIMQADRLSSIGELAAGVAHEINNPINGIINYAQMLKDQTQESGEENDIFERIIKEGERIASIVSNLLKFSKDRRENFRPISIQTPLNGVLDLVGTQMKKEGIRISVKLPPDLPQAIINSQQIQQVFLNLLSNTRYALNQKYPGDHPEKTLNISGKRIISNQGRPQIRLTFRDAGIGIPKAFLDKIFTPFFTTKLAEKGTGLGLSISRKIIQDHGGRLWLESREGKYTNAIVELPAAEEK